MVSALQGLGALAGGAAPVLERDKKFREQQDQFRALFDQQNQQFQTRQQNELKRIALQKEAQSNLKDYRNQSLGLQRDQLSIQRANAARAAELQRVQMRALEMDAKIKQASEYNAVIMIENPTLRAGATDAFFAKHRYDKKKHKWLYDLMTKGDPDHANHLLKVMETQFPNVPTSQYPQLLADPGLQIKMMEGMASLARAEAAKIKALADAAEAQGEGVKSQTLRDWLNENQPPNYDDPDALEKLRSQIDYLGSLDSTDGRTLARGRQDLLKQYEERMGAARRVEEETIAEFTGTQKAVDAQQVRPDVLVALGINEPNGISKGEAKQKYPGAARFFGEKVTEKQQEDLLQVRQTRQTQARVQALVSRMKDAIATSGVATVPGNVAGATARAVQEVRENFVATLDIFNQITSENKATLSDRNPEKFRKELDGIDVLKQITENRRDVEAMILELAFMEALAVENRATDQDVASRTVLWGKGATTVDGFLRRIDSSMERIMGRTNALVEGLGGDATRKLDYTKASLNELLEVPENEQNDIWAAEVEKRLAQ